MLDQMVSSTSLPPIVTATPAAPAFRWGFTRDGVAAAAARNRSKRGHAFRVLANPNVSSKKGSNNEVIMVDPLEAKRLAAKQMQEIKAKEKFKRKRKIEAINGTWAMIGLTAGSVIEGETGRSFLEQLGDYLGTIVHFFMR